jgi:dienelactone hydrolase
MIERGFTVDGPEGAVPGVLWLPATEQARRPLVLLGHDGAGHKRDARMVDLARRLVLGHGMAVVAIDGPFHGDRRADGGQDPAAVARDLLARAPHIAPLLDRLVTEWRLTLDAVHDLDGIGHGPVGYAGLSMGTAAGIPLVAGEPRISAAVFGSAGIPAAASPDPMLEYHRVRLGAVAPAVTCPVLVVQQWDDQVFPRDACLNLFDAIGSTEKRLHVTPGRHGRVPPDELDAAAAFLAAHLR